MLEELRRRAEDALAAGEHRFDDRAAVDLATLIHELEVHQVELEMQNEELRLAQAELTRSQARYHDLYDLAPFGYLSLDSAGRIDEANLRAAELLGVSTAALVGHPLARFLRQRDGDRLHIHLQEVRETSEKKSCELSLHPGGPHDTGALPVHLETALVEDTEPPRFRSVLIDLSDLRSAQESLRSSEARGQRAQRDLRDSEARFRQIAEHVHDAFLLHDRASRRVTYASPAFEEISGRPVADIHQAGADLLDWIHPSDRARVAAAYDKMLEGEPFDDEYRLIRPDGAARWIRCRSFPVHGANGPVISDVAVVQDITVERALEAQLRQAQKMEALGALASGVAHDFNNVLQAIVGCVDVALSGDTAPDLARQMLDRAKSAAKRGSALSSQLMAFTRKQAFEPHVVSLDRLLEKLAPLLERLLTENISLEVHVGAGGHHILADPVQIEQIFMNLAANARDAMPEGGTLSIRTSSTGDHPPARQADLGRAGRYVKVIVKDTGLGMDEQTQARIFEPFFTTKQVGKGTGLGLSTVFAITDQLGGQIVVESEEGSGTAFALYFPTVQEEPEGDALVSADQLHLAGTVLVVEDEPLVRMTVSHYLRELGLSVLEAGDASEAKRVCSAHPGTIDFLVSDVVLPLMSGPKLAALLRGLYPELRVLLMSANSELIGGEGLTEGFPMLIKPFDKATLGRRLAELAS